MTEDGRSTCGFESSDLSGGGQIEVEDRAEGSEHGNEHQQNEGSRVDDHQKGAHDLRQHEQNGPEVVREGEVDDVDVLREAVHDASRRRRIEEVHRRVKQCIYSMV